MHLTISGSWILLMARICTLLERILLGENSELQIFSLAKFWGLMAALAHSCSVTALQKAISELLPTAHHQHLLIWVMQILGWSNWQSIWILRTCTPLPCQKQISLTGNLFLLTTHHSIKEWKPPSIQWGKMHLASALTYQVLLRLPPVLSFGLLHRA